MKTKPPPGRPLEPSVETVFDPRAKPSEAASWGQEAVALGLQPSCNHFPKMRYTSGSGASPFFFAWARDGNTFVKDCLQFRLGLVKALLHLGQKIPNRLL